MGIDIRLPLGAMFALLGALLTGFGLTSTPEVYARSLGLNVNLWWGLVLLAFGVLMLWLARRARRG
jgi:multisubunit Na+/H+ antiporter MnhG subunit